MHVDIISTTSTLRRRARLMEARERRKSPASTASLLPKTWFTESTPRRVSAVSSTSSWRRLAVWISSLPAASRARDGGRGRGAPQGPEGGEGGAVRT